MQNNLFNIKINQDGTIKSIVNPNDSFSMNWLDESFGWGNIRYCDYIQRENGKTWSVDRYKWLTSCSTQIDDTKTFSVYKNDDVSITVERFFDTDGALIERYTLKNLRKSDLFLEQGDIAIALPFNDIYTYADDCMTNRCNTHIWCGANSTYVKAVKMGESDINLGLVLTEGAFASYSVCRSNSNHRGVFLLDCEHLELLPSEEYVWQWKLFWFKDDNDFNLNLSTIKNYLQINAEHFTVFMGEQIKFSFKPNFKAGNVCVSLNGESVLVKEENNSFFVEYMPTAYREHKFIITVDNIHTYTEFYVSDKPLDLIKKRLDFIISKQQYKRQDSSLNGAFLLYDNKLKYPVFDAVVRDHNACRERMGMSLLLVKYLQKHKNTEYQKALDLFLQFLYREFVDINDGVVFDGAGKNKEHIRLYNAPWVVTFFCEMYYLTKDSSYLSHCVKILDNYYKGGGSKFYPNGLSMKRTLDAFLDAKMQKEKDLVFSWFKMHVDNIVKNGTSYPKHEVNYEQTIVTPAATFVSEFASITKDKVYINNALEHIKLLKRFAGNQPSFHLNQIPIRYWDAFWFGKSRTFGDTMPHYWSCLSARSFVDYYFVSFDDSYKESALECIRNCLCLFNENGEGFCAYVYPFTVNEKSGEFYDEWANDQDFALYFYLTITEDI